MNKEKIIKAQAKAALNRNNWSTLVGCLAVLTVFFVFALYAYYSLLYGFGTVDYDTGEISDSKSIQVVIATAVFTVLLALISPVLNGYSRLCYNTAKYEACSAGELLYYFKSPVLYFRAIGLNAIKVVFLAIVFAICTIPSDIMYALAEGGGSLEAMGDILAILGAIGATVICVRLLFCNFILAEDENTPATECARLAFAVTKGHSGDLIRLLLSFIPWLLLCCLVFPLFYVVPYMETSFAASAKWLISLKKEEAQC